MSSYTSRHHLALSALFFMTTAALFFLTGCERERVACGEDGDCLPGYFCQEQVCVAGDALPPVEEADAGSQDAGPDAVTVDCPDGEPNECGGCEALAEAVGSACGGDCGEGTWECATENTLECQSESDDINACGGCEPLDAAPGDSCGDCGETVCGDDNESVSCNDPGFNSCGGCGLLAGEPGEVCGDCERGLYACLDDGSLLCDGEVGFNACGGCGSLDGTPGAACGGCEDGSMVCNETGTELFCEGASDFNDCGGCSALAADLGAACGVCSNGEWACGDDLDSLFCDGETGFNACGGCDVLEASPGEPCGDCVGAIYACDDTGEGLACDESGIVLNECGGCNEIPGEIDDFCCGGEGDGVWDCDDGEAICDDDNNTRKNADDNLLGTLLKLEFDSTEHWMDSADDVDWYGYAFIDDTIGPFEPQVSLETESDAIDYDLCIFYEYNDDDNEMIDYTCSSGDACSFYDASHGVVRDSSCNSGSSSFNADEDLYGCCDFDADFEGFWEVQLTDIDDFEDQSGTIYIRVSSDVNEAADGCGFYVLDTEVEVDF